MCRVVEVYSSEIERGVAFISSSFVDFDKVSDFVSADRALLEVLAALDAGRVVLAGHVEGVPIVFAADHAGVLVVPLALRDDGLVPLEADIGRGRADLEDRFVLERERLALFVLSAQSLPGSVGLQRRG